MKSDKNLYDLLIFGAIKGDIEIIKKCLEKNRERNIDKNVLLKLASQKGFLDIVEYLVESGTDIQDAKTYGTNQVVTWANQYVSNIKKSSRSVSVK